LQLDEDPENKLAWINVSNIQELAAALGTANVTVVSDTDLYLKRDIMVNDIIGINAGTYNLDFRGFHISSYDYVNIYDANMTFFDSSASQSGGIHGPEDATSTYWGVKGGSLTIKSGTYTGKDSLFSLSGGALTIEGGRFTSRGVNE
ncbi:hypothetical protein, partial [Klebsiella pneumoniae]|uniref:hypothetical protein n=1 Tax=Klebsiella pneumoniae TaxID=573 RepID=UPI001C8F2F3B